MVYNRNLKPYLIYFQTERNKREQGTFRDFFKGYKAPSSVYVVQRLSTSCIIEYKKLLTASFQIKTDTWQRTIVFNENVILAHWLYSTFAQPLLYITFYYISACDDKCLNLIQRQFRLVIFAQNMYHTNISDLTVVLLHHCLTTVGECGRPCLRLTHT